MRLREYQIVLAAVTLPLLLLWGCQSNQAVSPTKVVDLGVSLSTQGSPKSKLLNATSDLVYFNVSGPLSPPIAGTAGPFSTTTGSGSISFNLNNIPVGVGEILSVELVDNSNGTPQAIGAASLADAGSGVTVDMGSLVRSCYSAVPSTTYSCNGSGGGVFTFNGYYAYYGSANFTLVPDTYDMQWVGITDTTTCFGTYDLQDAWTGDGNTKSIAYLGNGHLVDFDKVPSDANFYSDGGAAKLAAGAPVTTLEKNDIFCVKLQGGTSPGHAWVQFNSVGDANDSPSFVFRVRNDATPYYLYDQSTADLGVGTLISCTLDDLGL
ncbi:MAG: hypothetical protein ACREL1_02400 [bacterium]